MTNVYLAPMAGITDYPFRKITKALGEGQMFSEMVAINAIQRKNPKSYRIADVRSEPYPVIVQLVGGNVDLYPEAIKLLEELGAASIDINMGCPVKKIVNNKSGSYLMTDMEQAAKIISTCVNNSNLDISVKFRKGWDNNHINAVEFAKMCEDNGAKSITLHGRTRSQFYSGEADWDIIAEVKQTVQIPLIANGDVNSPHTAKRILEHTKADGVMIGRAALGNPWIISQTYDYLNKGLEPKPISTLEIKSLLLNHFQELIEYYGERMAIPISRKFVCWYCKNLREAKKFREFYTKINNYNEAITEIHKYFDTLENNI